MTAPESRIAQSLHGRTATIPWRQKRGQRWLKRLLDLAVALGLLFLLWPVMLVVALLVRLTSPGPILFKQARIGLDGRAFQMVKFRSMEVLLADGSAGVGGEVTTRDARLTPIGGRLRAWRLDELPQLLQVLSGQMSLVGPRPDIWQNLGQYTSEQMLRFAMPPGCTAWTFTRGAFANDWATRQNINVEYVQQWSLWLDMKILVGSLFVLLSQKDANPDTAVAIAPKSTNANDT
ncbi:MAG: sugar transferase [Chloroflexi bacterium]|nr:sugar transferase [Chloroflexota bacterium]GIK56055.1 MAG: hypothetical protein BroJett015_17180 [Chloroflexota bacterium]